MRTSNPVSTVQLPDRCYTLDVAYPLMVVGTAERHVQIFNLSNPTTPFKVRQSESWTCTAELNSSLPLSDNDVATQVANTRNILLS
jgi:hypothetical protein